MIVPTIHVAEGTMPILGLGTWQLQGRRCVETVREALSMGYTHIDTAEIYGNEKEVGEAISAFPRDRLYLTSKVWWGNLGHDAVIDACEASLARLGTDYLDLYLIHWPNRDVEMEETFRALRELRNRGRIRAFGVSNFTERHLERALSIAGQDVAVNQVEFHPLLYQKGLKAYCEENGVQLVAYSPLAHGELVHDETLEGIGRAHGASAAQIALAWLRCKGLVAIPKASSAEHLKANLLSLDITLDEEEIERIDALDMGRRFVSPSHSEFAQA